MSPIRSDRIAVVTGLDGRPLRRKDLPAANTKRWVASRKAAVVAAVNGGLITEAEACEIYGLSGEELEGWRRAVARHGVNALRTTALKRYRAT